MLILLKKSKIIVTYKSIVKYDIDVAIVKFDDDKIRHYKVAFS